MSEWHQIKEQQAGKFRLAFLWDIYRLFRLKGLKIILYPVVALLYPGLSEPRKQSLKYRQILYTYQKKHHLTITHFSTFTHILSYATALAEKMNALCDNGNALSFHIPKDEDTQAFLNNLKNKKGMFLISSHLGNIEILSALAKILPQTNSKLFALMQTNQNQVFFQFIQKHIKNKNFELIPAQEFDFQKIMGCYEALQAGSLWLMAADRVPPNNTQTLPVKLLNHPCQIPQGVFRFARAVKHPVFAVTLLHTQSNTYTLYVKQLNATQPIQKTAQEYMDFTQELLLSYPKQWYNFFDFFKN